MSHEQFRSYWQDDQFDSLIGEMASSTLANRFVKNLTLTVEANVRIMQDRGSAEPFDGVIEYWWSNAKELMEIFDTPEFKIVADKLLAYQKEFIDVENSSGFFTESN